MAVLVSTTVVVSDTGVDVSVLPEAVGVSTLAVAVSAGAEGLGETTV